MRWPIPVNIPKACFLHINKDSIMKFLGFQYHSLLLHGCVLECLKCMQAKLRAACEGLIRAASEHIWLISLKKTD